MKTTGPFTARPGTARGRTRTIGSGGGRLHIRAACLSVLGGIQPGPLERYLREVFAGRGDDGLLQRFQLAVWPDGGGPWRNVDRWPNAGARARVIEVFERLRTLTPGALGAEELTPEELPFLRFEAAAQEVFDAWRAALEQTLRAEAEHPVLLSHWAKYRSLMPSLALIFQAIDAVDAGTRGPVTRAAAERATAWCTYLEARNAPALRDDDRRGARGGRRARDQDQVRAGGEPIHRARGVSK
jgi:Protein of unknown function (DUF3987)